MVRTHAVCQSRETLAFSNLKKSVLPRSLAPTAPPSPPPLDILSLYFSRVGMPCPAFPIAPPCYRYEAQNPEGSKTTEGEWKAAHAFVQSTSNNRKSMSTQSRASASRNRSRISSHLEMKKDQTKTNFARRVDEVKSAREALSKCLKECEEEHDKLTQKLAVTEEMVSTRFDWPIVVNQACVKFREQRIGIDKVMDRLEIELLKENDMLNRVSSEQFDEPIYQTKRLLEALEHCMYLLSEDIKRKEGAEAIDTKLSTLVSSKTLSINLDIIKTRPITGIEMNEWRQSSENLIEGTYRMMAESGKMRKKLTKATKITDKLLNEAQEAVDLTMRRSVNKAESARDDVSSLLAEVKGEAITTEQEVAKLEKLISLQETPLKRATTQLAQRAMRPEGEQTNDHVHESLIQEVADLDNAVSALTEELNISMRNLEELRNLEGLLEEDYTIKKNTLLLETRCSKSRGFLDADTDPYVIRKMMGDPKFMDLMTR